MNFSRAAAGGSNPPAIEKLVSPLNGAGKQLAARSTNIPELASQGGSSGK